MTNKKICDKCKTEIQKGIDYFKLLKIKHIPREFIGLYFSQDRKVVDIQNIPAGHLCEKCIKEITQ